MCPLWCLPPQPPAIILDLVCLVFTNQVLGKTTEVGGHRVLVIDFCSVTKVLRSPGNVSASFLFHNCQSPRWQHVEHSCDCLDVTDQRPYDGHLVHNVQKSSKACHVASPLVVPTASSVSSIEANRSAVRGPAGLHRSATKWQLQRQGFAQRPRLCRGSYPHSWHDTSAHLPLR